MRILSIETSCDETAISVLEAEGGFDNPQFKILGDSLLSQIKQHRKYGGVYPNLAKREHAKNLIPLLEKTLEEAGLLKTGEEKVEGIEEILEREPGLLENFKAFVSKIEKPDIDYIGVTQGPGLEPALWVGINFAKALSKTWNIPLIPVNHMEGHVLSPVFGGDSVEFPAIALLISGGHTELVLMKDWLKYKKIGETQDDAVGEAFDKVARMLDLPYPGGPEISKLAKETRGKDFEESFNFPRPMIKADNCHFSFSGLKTAVLYTIKNLDLDEKTKEKVAREFEDAVVEVLLEKTKRSLDEFNPKTLILGGGVVANTEIRAAFKKLGEERDLKVLIPEQKLTTDNSIMIGIAGYFRALKNPRGVPLEKVRADGNLSIED